MENNVIFQKEPGKKKGKYIYLESDSSYKSGYIISATELHKPEEEYHGKIRVEITNEKNIPYSTLVAYVQNQDTVYVANNGLLPAEIRKFYIVDKNFIPYQINNVSANYIKIVFKPHESYYCYLNDKLKLGFNKLLNEKEKLKYKRRNRFLIF